MGVLRRLSPSFRRKSMSSRNVSAIDAEVDFVMQRSPFLLAAEQQEEEEEQEQQQQQQSSSAASSSDTSLFAEFQRKEFQIGSLLGEGSFSKVHAIIGFRLTATRSTKAGESQQQQQWENEKRIALSRCAFDNKGAPKFAVKYLKKELSSKKSSSSHDFRHAAADLVVEAKYLAALDHPNIVKLRGVARGSTMSFCDGHDGFFIIMDLLQESLDQRIQRWKGEQQEDHDQHAALVPLRTKANYALQIADALAYLHERRIVYRDLKPGNLAFRQDDPDTIQLLDFGLCRELPESGSCSQEDEDDGDGMFHMSGAGSRSYMAVEIFNKKCYNLKADVYSWALCLYEMIALSQPFNHYTFLEHKEFVAEIGMRPELKKEYCLPPALEDLIRSAWEQDPVQRLNIRQVCDKLRPFVSVLGQQDGVAMTDCLEGH